VPGAQAQAEAPTTRATVAGAGAGPGATRATLEASERAPMWRELALVLLVKASASAVALAVGFRAVSDDDFARVVHAQSWAHAPRLDPTGTSWLPAPFWITGLVMRLLGPGLDVARGVAFALGLTSAALIYLAARWIMEDSGAHPRAALAGALLAAVFPWSARLGVATVPELPAAALTLLAVASLCSPSPDRRLWGAGALVVATLSRYEPWPVAGAFAVFSVFSALRLGQGRAAQVKLVAAALVALAGPAAWVAWNHVAHGDALHFLVRVAAYRQALRPEGDGSLARLLAYPAAMLREEPELVLSPLALWLVTRGTPLGASLAAGVRPFLLPAALAVFQVAALSAALVRDGAPTHHPERATLVALLVLALLSGRLSAGPAGAVKGAPPPTRPSGGATPQSGMGAALSRGAALGMGLRFGVAGIALLFIGAGWIRRWYRQEHFNARVDEVAVGRAAGALLPPGTPVLLEVPHYGYFAVLAALGRPGQVVLDRSIDPRDPPVASSFADPVALRRRLAAAGCGYFIGQQGQAGESVAGAPRAAHGRWALWDVRAAPAVPAAPVAAEEPPP